jgi:hypothetical protein
MPHRRQPGCAQRSDPRPVGAVDDPAADRCRKRPDRSQLFESLTAVDAVRCAGRPTLAEENDGKRVSICAPKFSNGDALAEHVVSSWMRVIDPSRSSQLASLLDGVVGARSYREVRQKAPG